MTGPAGPHLLEARGLSKAFGAVPALRGVDVSLVPGEIVALFGPNGAGKTTLVRCLASLVRPDAGRVLIGGEDLRGGSAGRLRARIGFVGHQTLLYDSLTVEENLRFYAALYGRPAPGALARRMLREFGLAGRAADPARALSRGMQQRLSLARALLHDPEILLLDEPATGLDPSAAEALRGRLAAMRGRGRAAVIVSHDIPGTLAIADRYIVIAGGRVAAEAPARGADPAQLVRDHFPSAAPAAAAAGGAGP